MAYAKDTDPGIIVPRKWWDALPRASWKRFQQVETSQTWFEVYEITPECYAIYEPGQFEEVISHLVLGEDEAALVDTGNGIGNIKALVEELTDLPTKVVNTHSHGDHTGDNWRFEEVELFDTAFSRERLRGRTAEEMGNYLGDGMIAKPLPRGVNPTGFISKPFNVTRWLKEGDKIDLGGKKLEVIHIPGHTPCSICLLERKERLLFTGDMYYPAGIYVYSPDRTLDDFIRSFRKMVDAPEYTHAMTGHNETYMERSEVEAVLKAAMEIREGRGGSFKTGIATGIKVRRYDYKRFSLVVRDE